MADKPNIDQLFNLRATFPKDEEKKAFFKAAKDDDMKTLAQIIDKWPDAAKKWRDSNDTVLTECFKQLSPPTIKFLIGHGADIDQFDDETFWSPLALAAFHGDLDSVEKLLRLGANPDNPNKYGQTPLSFAAEKNNHACADLLVVCGANPASGLDKAKKEEMRDVINAAKQRRDDFVTKLDQQIATGEMAPAAPAAPEDHIVHVMKCIEFKKKGLPPPPEETPVAEVLPAEQVAQKKNWFRKTLGF